MVKVLNEAETLSILIPLLIANGSPVLLAKGIPIDLGRVFIDGKRILGDGKTIEGYVLGLVYGFSVGLFLINILVNDVKSMLIKALVISINGGLLGDIIAAFFKRRLGLERGYHVKVLDQLDFIIGSLLLLRITGYVCSPFLILIFIPLVYVLHRATNYAAYKIGLKNVPW